MRKLALSVKRWFSLAVNRLNVRYATVLHSQRATFANCASLSLHAHKKGMSHA